MEVKKTLIQGTMNKGVDERLLPDGQILHAENVRIVTTDSDSAGVAENNRGNERLTNMQLKNAKTIGGLSDGKNGKLYWLIYSEEKDLLMEYNTRTNVLTTILESTRVGGVLNLHPNYLVTGIVKLFNDDFNKDLLAWTDDRNQPRCINIERCKTFTPNGFEEEDINLIKKPPIFAPKAQMTFTASTRENNLENKFVSFAYRYKYLDGEYSALSSFTNYAFSPKKFDLDYQTMENMGMVNNFNAVRLTFNTGSRRVTDIELVFKESNSNTIFMIERFKKVEQNWDNDVEKQFVFSNSKIYTTLPSDEISRQFDNVPRKAKALDYVVNRLMMGNYVEGYNLINMYGEDINLDYDVSVVTKSIQGTQIPLTISPDRFNLNFDLTNIELKTDTRLNFSLELEQIDITGVFQGDVDFILNRDYTGAADLISDTDFQLFITDILSNKFIQDYTATPPANSNVPVLTPFSIVGVTGSTVTIGSPSLTYTIDDTPSDPNDNQTHDETFRWGFRGTSTLYFKNVAVDSSMKSNRSYEVGIVYRDNYARKTTVLTDITNTIYIPQDLSINQNKLRVRLNHLAPMWADTYKLVVKQNKGEYQTIYANVFYQEGIYRWVLLEGANKDKVKEGDTLIVKSDLSGFVSNLIKVRVLEVSVKPRNFIEVNYDVDGNEIVEEQGLYMKIKPIGFNMNFDASTSRLFLGSQGLRYPSRCFTNPQFGQYVNGTFVPYKLKSGSRIRINIKVEAFGKIEFEHEFDKRYRVQTDYDSVQQWFEAEVQNLGQFGKDYLWNGVDDIGPNIGGQGAGQADAFNRYSGWDFTPNGDGFWVVPWRKGTNSRNIYTSMRWEVFFSEGDVIFETEPLDTTSEIYYETEQTFKVVNGLHMGNASNQTNSTPALVDMDSFNCYVQGNGAESYRYKDVNNAKWLNIDLRPSATSVERYKEVRRFADLTYGEPYNDSTNINGLNEFNLSRANFKDDISKKYGSIQKIFARDNDVLVLQEDKISKVLYEKDLLMNADGTSNVTSINRVLGRQIPYLGEYGISNHPESFVFDGFNIYFSDAKRGAIMRLAGDGINEVVNGMAQFFKNKFRNEDFTAKKGGYDPHYDEYYFYDSKDPINPPTEIGCGTRFVEKNFSGLKEINVNYGVGEGEASFSFMTNEKPIKFTVDVGNDVYETGFYGSSEYNDDLITMGYSPVVSGGVGNFSFNKTRLNPRNPQPNTDLSLAKITVIAPFVGTDLDMSTVCPIDNKRNVVTAIFKGNDITHRYQYDTWSNWGLSGVIGQPIEHSGSFELDGQVFETLTGVEGVNRVPKSGSTIKIMKGFKGMDIIGKAFWLLTDIQYTESDMPNILNTAIEIPLGIALDSQGSPAQFGDFIMPTFDKKYLYIIFQYDY